MTGRNRRTDSRLGHNANRSLANATQLSTETEFCTRRPEAGTAAAGRKSQSPWGLLCAPRMQVPDMTWIFRETENHVISNSCVVELRGFEPLTSGVNGVLGLTSAELRFVSRSSTPVGCRSAVYPGRRPRRLSHRRLISLQVDVVGPGARIALLARCDHISPRPRCRAAACDHIGRNLAMADEGVTTSWFSILSRAFERAIEVQVGCLRRKIEADPKNPALIKTVRSGGYVLASAVESR